MPLSALAVAACGGSSEPAPAASDGPLVERATERGAVLAQACSGCHSESGGAIASLTSYDAAQLRDTLLRYKSETDGTTVMHRLARGYTDDDIDLVSAYLEQVEGDS